MHPIFHGIDPSMTGRKCKQWWNLREDRTIILSGFCVTLISAAMLDVTWYSLIITVSNRSDYCCSASSTDFLTSHPDAMHQDLFGRKRQTSYRYFLHWELFTRTLSGFERTNCKRKLWGLEDNRTRQHARDYLSFRNALSVIKRIINGTRFYEKACAHCSNKCYADTFINHGKSFDKLLS